MKRKIILASSSPRRVQLLKEAGISFDQYFPSDVDESRNEGESSEAYVKRLALAKARSGLTQHPQTCVIGADTVVIAPNGDILGKPKDRDEAFMMLHKLQGNTHQVITAYALVWEQQKVVRSVLSLVQFRNLSSKAIDSYLDNYDEWKDKAGSYAIQGIGASFVLSINGSYHNVVGLPITHVVADLESIFEIAYPTFAI